MRNILHYSSDWTKFHYFMGLAQSKIISMWCNNRLFKIIGEYMEYNIL